MAKEVLQIQGLREIALAGRKLTGDVTRKIVGRALVSGGKIVRNAARNLAPSLSTKYQSDPRRLPGTLKNAIVSVQVKKGDYPEEVMSIVGVRMLSKSSIKKFKEKTGKSGAANPRDPYYWWFVEKGTSGHARRSKSIGGIRYLKRGFESNVQPAAEEIKKKSAAGIYKYGNTLATGKTR